MSSALRWTLNGVLLAVACLLAADIANEVVAAAPSSRSPDRIAASPASPAAPDRTWASRQVILERNLFGAIGPEMASPPARAETIELAARPAAMRGNFGEHAVLTWLLQQTQLVPKFEGDGEMVGLEVGAVGPGSLFEKIGLESGDVITEFNGIAMSSQADSAKILSEMIAANEYHVVGRAPDGSEQVWDFVREN